jgi:methenyltetrahydromethanopterin cyclohydrolase
MSLLNESAWELCDKMVADSAALDISVSTLNCGTRIIDCGVKALGNIETGRRLAEVCMSGWGDVYLEHAAEGEPTTQLVCVNTKLPVAACMASQYAGWEINDDGFFAMGSGPMRAAAGREELFDTIGNREQADRCVGVLECSKLPPDSVCCDIANKCHVTPDRLTLLVARTSSPAGTVQIVARSVETALHKLHVLGFDLERILGATGVAPLPPIANDDLVAIGWTNDAILYGAEVTLLVRGNTDDIASIGPRVPSCASPDYGRPFAEIFAKYNRDFYRIDPMLFSPALVLFIDPTDIGSFQSFGSSAPDLLAESFGAKK